jgi:mitochondrial fission process protein 1
MNIRYLGYSNELGEALRPVLPYLVIPSYIIAVGYMLYDSYTKAKKSKNKVSKFIDTIIWQALATIIIPSYVIHKIVYFTKDFIKDIEQINKYKLLKDYLPSVIGILSIFFIMQPIDDLVDYMLDNTIRKL